MHVWSFLKGLYGGLHFTLALYYYLRGRSPGPPFPPDHLPPSQLTDNAQGSHRGAAWAAPDEVPPQKQLLAYGPAYPASPVNRILIKLVLYIGPTRRLVMPDAQRPGTGHTRFDGMPSGDARLR